MRQNLAVSLIKAGANQSNISTNITFLPCWMKCWNGLRNYKIYKVSKKKKKIMLDDVGWSLFQNKISSNMFWRKSMNCPCWTSLVGCFIQHSQISADFESWHGNSNFLMCFRILSFVSITNIYCGRGRHKTMYYSCITRPCIINKVFNNISIANLQLLR